MLYQEMVDGLDWETLSKICKKGFQSRQLELRDLIAAEINNQVTSGLCLRTML